MKSHERGSILLAIIGIAMVLFMIGFFRSEQGFWGNFNYKTAMRLKCGLTITKPIVKTGVATNFPTTVAGYITGCGWSPSAHTAGRVQVFDSKGNALSDVDPLVIPADSTESPYYFESVVQLRTAPSTDTGTLLFTSNVGLLTPVQISF